MENHDSSSNNGVGGHNNKVKLLCSYGGKIQFRPADHHLHYAGGDTKFVTVDRAATLSEIVAKLISLWPKIGGSDFAVKYQLHGQDLDSLVSLIDDGDVRSMLVEYDLMQMISAAKRARLRLFVFDISAPPPPPPPPPPPVSSAPSNPDYLFGFDEEYKPSVDPPPDLLQIPPENWGSFSPCEGKKVISKIEGEKGIAESHVDSRVINSESVSWAPVVTATEAIYRGPLVVNGGGMYRTGNYAYGVVPAIVTGNREQPVYSFVPVIQSDRRKVNQRN
ncbi:hypothetical protein ABFS83_08G063700 [Erythranthe nasuta]